MRLSVLLETEVKTLAEELWKSDPVLFSLLKWSTGKRNARERISAYLNSKEYALFDVYSREESHPIEKNNAKQCIRVLKNIIRTENEKAAGFSAVKLLLSLSKEEYPKGIGGFICELIHLFKGTNANSGIFKEEKPGFMKFKGRKAALSRSQTLDEYCKKMKKSSKNTRAGLTLK